jgi:hypothetical protein
LTDKSSGEEVGLIENKPGSAGSVRVYSYLIDTFGNSTDLTIESIAVFEFFFSGEEITRQAAYLALAIYAEHVEDAHSNRGKHGNIDRLLDIILTGKTLVGEIVGKDQEASKWLKSSSNPTHRYKYARVEILDFFLKSGMDLCQQITGMNGRIWITGSPSPRSKMVLALRL